jgi:hypothetical protein
MPLVVPPLIHAVRISESGANALAGTDRLARLRLTGIRTAQGESIEVDGHRLVGLEREARGRQVGDRQVARQLVAAALRDLDWVSRRIPGSYAAGHRLVLIDQDDAIDGVCGGGQR